MKITEKEFQEHCKDNYTGFKLAKENRQAIEKKLDKLMPLVDLIPTLEDIAENQKAMTVVGKKVMKVIGVIATILGLIYLIFRFWKEIK